MRHERTEQIARVEPDTDAFPRVVSPIPAATPPLPVALWRQLLQARNYWAISVLVSIAGLLWLLAAFLLAAAFRGVYAAQPVLVVVGVAAALVLIDVTVLSAMLVRDRRAERRTA